MLRSRLLLAVLTVSFVAACAQGGGAETDGGGGTRDAGAPLDGSPEDDAGRGDAGRRDGGGGTSCPTGQHACGGGCIDDLPNEPANGCRLGCGEACPAPAMGTASCSSAGACDFTCPVPFRREGDACVCTPRTCESMGAMCGAPDDGCGTTLDCGTCASGACVDGRCSCAPDPHEPANDSRSNAPSFGSYDDSEDPPDGVVGDLSLDEETDVDWMRFSIVDGNDFGNPELTVTLDRVPSGADYRLSAFYVCGGGTDASTCSMGSSDNEVGRGCSASTGTAGSAVVAIATECEHLSTDESGTLYVRVRASTWGGSCEPYRVRLRVR